MTFFRVLSVFCITLFAGGGFVSAQSEYSGHLRSGDEELVSGEYSDSYSVYANEGEWIALKMTSYELDPYLILTPPDCALAGQCDLQHDNDDVESGDPMALIVARADRSGSWKIIATSSVPGESGSYDLEVFVFENTSDFDGLDSFRIDQNDERRESGYLEEGDKALNSGEYVDNYAFVGRAGESFVIDLRSTEFDPYIILFMPDDSQEDNDDWEGDIAHSRIESVLPVDGMYRVSVTSYQPGETGRYDLEIQHQIPFDKPDDEDKQ